MENKILSIYNTLDQMFPDAGCELIYHNLYELCIAVILSAQTTDKAVNKVTPQLFNKYPDFSSLAASSENDVINLIKTIGLAKSKAHNIINLAKIMVDKYQNIVPNDFNTLITLPGIGRKTANVILSEGFKIPALAVDTHVERVSKRLGLTDINNDVIKVETDLKKQIDESLWHHTHHLFIFFGRYFCTAKKPRCEECPFKTNCTYNK